MKETGQNGPALHVTIRTVAEGIGHIVLQVWVRNVVSGVLLVEPSDAQEIVRRLENCGEAT